MGKIDQGVMVLWVARHFWKKPLSYIGYGGKGKQVRDILHVDDLFRLVDYQIHHMEHLNGKTLNVGGGLKRSISLLELTEMCRRVTGNTIDIEEISKNRDADIRIYITDNSQVSELTGWEPTITTEEVVSQIFSWIKDNEKNLRSIIGN